jgi:hypothetical protein
MTDSTNPAATMADGLAGELERLLVSENEALNAVTVGSHAAYHRAADAKLLWLKNNAERILAALRPAQPAAVEVEALRGAHIPDWPDAVVLPNGGLLFMEGNITSDTHPFSVGALRPDKTLLWEKRYVNFRTARQHFDRCVAALTSPDGGRNEQG